LPQHFLRVGGCGDKTIADIITGDYHPYSSNHGKPVYKKEATTRTIEVLIYFWDDRDGPELCGWWFGPNVGGEQVWAYHPSRSAATPPAGEWNVPHDGQIDPAFSVKAQRLPAGTKRPFADEGASGPRASEEAQGDEKKHDAEDQKAKQERAQAKQRARPVEKADEPKKGGDVAGSGDADGGGFDEKLEKRRRQKAAASEKTTGDVVEEGSARGDVRGEDAEEARKQSSELRRTDDDGPRPEEPERRQDEGGDRRRPAEGDRRRDGDDASGRKEEQERRRRASKSPPDERRSSEDEKRLVERRRLEEELQKRRYEKRRAEDAEREKVEAEKRKELDAKRKEEERRQKMEAMRQEISERKRLAEEMKKEELSKKKAEVEAKKAEVEAKRKEAELKAIQQQQATVSVLRMLKKISKVSPDTFDSLKAEFEEVLRQELPRVGEQQDVLKAEGDSVLENAKHFVAQVAEYSRIAVEHERLANGALEELERLIGQAEVAADSASNAATPFTGNVELEDAQVYLIAHSVEDSVKCAMAACSTCGNFLKQNIATIQAAETIKTEVASKISRAGPRIQAAAHRATTALKIAKSNREKLAAKWSKRW